MYQVEGTQKRMMSNMSARASAYPRRSKVLGLALISILAVVLLAGAGSLHASASASAGLDNVQVFIHTSQDLAYSYTLTVYNTSGIQVAYYTSNFPAAAFELPNGTYLFTVQASYGSGYYPCIGCVSTPMIPANSTTTITSYTTSAASVTPMGMPAKLLVINSSDPMIPANSTTPTNSTLVTVKPIFVTNSTGIEPIFVLAPSSNEYGYSVDQVTGPSTITINTYNATTFPTTQVTVHVAYVNGTAVQGAWVYASVIDDYYYYYGSNFTLNAQTGADGNAVLTVPQAPLLVTSDFSVPITLPQNQSTVTVTVGGQKVNVTLYYYPSSVNLEGQTLILPPQTSGSITLQYQPQVYYNPLPTGVSSPSGVYNFENGTVTAITTETKTLSENVVQGEIPPFHPTNVQVATPVNLPAATTTTKVPAKVVSEDGPLMVGGAVAIAVVLALTLVLVTGRGKRNQSIVSAS
jgi:hypothetical protein